MKIRSLIKKASSQLWTAVIGTALMMGACDNVIYDYEGDCSVNYLVKFRYDYNMKFADAFAHEVKSVTLYLMDVNGNVVWKKTESGDMLANPDYAMTVDVEPGQYQMLAWCGDTQLGSFNIPQTTVLTDLDCTMTREHDEDGFAHVRQDLDRLYHGYVEAQTFVDEEGTHVYEVPLMKNTNNVRVVLQHLSGEPVDKDKFHFTITDYNGKMDWDNTVLDDENIIYHAWRKESGVAGVADEGASHAYSAVLAELTVARLMTDHEPQLTVTNVETGEVVFSIPVNDYALLVKGFYNRNMPDQEYLDRQDEYNMTFFLDERDKWVDAYIYINSWKVVLQDSNL